ncbi:hypothetical protein FHR81_004357 [Actinoalloteichus hoggarensis]|uniref:Uncharacterized protein n=1 Tax=Actinoalloteichus hoggarensis TaxID=1470176 RepID=A0A221W9E1_9PSEU|nr:hypothetical protein AHOG_23415 [Actinoalloteichus hoggarensis]MBB5923290.1 hypothetical protein [Actinoalloteichus hoggarensis]
MDRRSPRRGRALIGETAANRKGVPVVNRHEPAASPESARDADTPDRRPYSCSGAATTPA